MAAIFFSFPMVLTIGKENFWQAWNVFYGTQFFFIFKTVWVSQKFGFPMVRINKMAAILSTIIKLNTIGKQNRPLPLAFWTCLVFQPLLYLSRANLVWKEIWNNFSIILCPLIIAPGACAPGAPHSVRPCQAWVWATISLLFYSFSPTVILILLKCNSKGRNNKILQWNQHRKRELNASPKSMFCLFFIVCSCTNVKDNKLI